MKTVSWRLIYAGVCYWGEEFCWSKGMQMATPDIITLVVQLNTRCPSLVVALTTAYAFIRITNYRYAETAYGYTYEDTGDDIYN